MASVRMMPPAGEASATVNGRAYASRPGGAIDVLAQDVSAMLGKGWTRDPLMAAIERGADRIASARVVAAELVEARQLRKANMAQETKNDLLGLSGLMRGLHSELIREAAVLAQRTRAVHERGMKAIMRRHAQTASVEDTVADMEKFADEVEAIAGDNLGPPLNDAPKSSG